MYFRHLVNAVACTLFYVNTLFARVRGTQKLHLCSFGATENARPDIARPSKLWGLISRDWITRHHIARVDIARLVSLCEYRSSIQVNICCREYYMSCASVVCVQFYLIMFNYFTWSVIPTCDRLSGLFVKSAFGRTVK